VLLWRNSGGKGEAWDGHSDMVLSEVIDDQAAAAAVFVQYRLGFGIE
jgi:hypothetical protein